MKQKRFFEMFGNYVFWKPGEIGHEGFNVDQLYKAFKQRIEDESEQDRVKIQQIKLKDQK